MPNEGVRAFLDGLGGPTRQVMEIFDGFKEQVGHRDEELLTAQRRFYPGSQEIRMIDTLRLARHFGTSYSATAYHLLNLKIIQKETEGKVLGEKKRGERTNGLLGILPYLEQEKQADLKQMTMSLLVEAWLQEKIGRPKAYAYMRLLELDPQKLDSLNLIA